jgi:hypothetical protein
MRSLAFPVSPLTFLLAFALVAFVCLFAFPLVSFRSLAIGLHVNSHLQRNVPMPEGYGPRAVLSSGVSMSNSRHAATIPLARHKLGPRCVDQPGEAIGHSTLVILWSPQPNA